MARHRISCTFGVAGCNPQTCNGHLGQAVVVHSDGLFTHKDADRTNV